MSEHRPRKIDREAAERLLHGGSSVPPDGSEALAGLLAAAAAPAQAGELAGESAALAAFWEASRSAAPRTRPEPGFRTTVAKFLTVRVAAAAVVLTAFGGAALAAEAGALPVTLSDSHGAARRQPVPVVQHPLVSLSPVTVSPHPVGSPRPSSATSSATAVAGLCRTYLARLRKAGFKDLSGKTHQFADEPGYKALLKAAGGEQKIVGHCKTVLQAIQHAGQQQNHWPTWPPGSPTRPPVHPPWPTEQPADHGGH
jgi:hypothetical protein